MLNRSNKLIQFKRFYSTTTATINNNDPPKLIKKDTIYSLSSGVGKSGVAVIRVSGPQSKNVLQSLINKEKEPKDRLATLGTFYHPTTKEPLDKGIYIWFSNPNSFTGEDVVEFHIHGGRAVIHDTLEAISTIPGTRSSQPGEFTKRSFDNGKLDLTQVEGLSDLLDAQTQHQRKIALDQMQGSIGKFYHTLRNDLIRASAYMEAFIDFGDDAELEPEIVEQSKQKILAIKEKIIQHLNDGRRGERLRDGAQIAIVGPPNAGKSSLLNLLAKRKASIVSPIPGTTRDIVEVVLDIGGYPVVVGDTAGIRHSTLDLIEKEGIEMAKERFKQSDIKLFLYDCSIHGDDADSMDLLLNIIDKNTILVFNKVDLVDKKLNWDSKRKEILDTIYQRKGFHSNYIEISCLENIGIQNLLLHLENNLKQLFEIDDKEAPLLTRVRYKEHLNDCVESLNRYIYYCDSDIVLASEELRSAIKSIGEITFSVNIDDLLDVIFKDFCIGK
ncbi:hypothetical protein CYY_007310 [Polysphondylium violaceum]|uniref:TrmE-type G domain-containing protein n=1 Tax=Polysphondylium violaceum TaxID=133409 RepID=A0A8J4UXS3_9MYCE|nr:hypothetical protein CYY_007310 [Polysphondylium violaceum]